MCRRAFIRLRFVALLLVWIAGSATHAQFLSSPFGLSNLSGLTAGTQMPRASYFKNRLNAAPLRAGPVFFSPNFGLTDASIVSDFGGPLNQLDFDNPGFDLSISARAGVRAYVSPYRRSILAFQLEPQYNWYLDDRNLRRLNLNYALGSFNYFGRLGIELSHRHTSSQRFFAADAPVVTTNERDLGRLAAEYRLWKDLRVFTVLTRRDINSTDEREDFDVLDRRSDEMRYGVVYRLPRDVNISLQRTEEKVDFGSITRDLSSRSTTDEFQFNAGFHRAGFLLVLQNRRLEPVRGSLIRRSQRNLGRIALPITPRAGTAITPYLTRFVEDAATGDFSEIIRDRIGLSFQGQMFYEIVNLSLAVEYGRDEFVPFAGSSLQRGDDVLTLGGQMGLAFPRIKRYYVPTVRFLRTEFTSNITGSSRVVSSFSFNIKIPWPWIPDRIRLPWKRFAWGRTDQGKW